MNRKKITWKFVDPTGVEHEFSNLLRFVNEHSDMFDAADLIPSARKLCRAYYRLVSLRSGIQKQWKGWSYAGEPGYKRPERSAEHCAKLGAATRKRMASPETRQLLSEVRRGKALPDEHPWRITGEEHHAAATGAFRAPNGVVYPYKNILHFVRTHQDLFDAEDLRTHKNKACAASAGLSGLRPPVRGTKRRQSITWKGWTLVS